MAGAVYALASLPGRRDPAPGPAAHGDTADTADTAATATVAPAVTM